MRSLIWSRIFPAVAVLAMAVAVLVPAVTFAAPVDVFQSCTGEAAAAGSAICKDQADQKLFGPGSVWNNILNTLIFVIGAAAVLMIIIGGLRYVLSGGDSGSVTAAKNTILYAVVGIIVAAMSYAIVNFVIASL